jgi:hypothetical protein
MRPCHLVAAKFWFVVCKYKQLIAYVIIDIYCHPFNLCTLSIQACVKSFEVMHARVYVSSFHRMSLTILCGQIPGQGHLW